MSEIKLQHMTPRPYYEQSRDFQLIGRLFDIVLNSVKTNADMIYNLPLIADTDEKLADLIALTLGFKLKHNYPAKPLMALCSAFPTALKKKGSLAGVEEIVKTLVRAEGLKDKWICETNDACDTVSVVVPLRFSNVTLLKDALEYVIPAGMSCEVSKMNFALSEEVTEIATSDTVRHRWIKHNTIAALGDEIDGDFSVGNAYDNSKSGYAFAGSVTDDQTDITEQGE